MKDQRHITMAIETSCDETSVALLADGREILSNITASQVDIFRAYGGVVPEIASRQHLLQINRCAAEAMAQAQVGWEQIDLIGVTRGPGLIGALLVGVATAKAFAFAHDIPLVGVHHLVGHISANYIRYPDLEPPFTALVVSGGHTALLRVTDYTDMKVLGQTRDDAVGEAYDKVARVLGLGYPGGPKLDALAQTGDPAAIPFKRVFLEKDSLDFSFSGLKTAVINYLHQAQQAGRKVNAADVAAGFQQAVMDVVVEKTMSAVTLSQGSASAAETAPRLVVAGGVAANACLRTMLETACRRAGVALYMPPLDLCTDNAAMIGCAAYYQYRACGADDPYMDADPSLPL